MNPLPKAKHCVSRVIKDKLSSNFGRKSGGNLASIRFSLAFVIYGSKGGAVVRTLVLTFTNFFWRLYVWLVLFPVPRSFYRVSGPAFHSS